MIFVYAFATHRVVGQWLGIRLGNFFFTKASHSSNAALKILHVITVDYHLLMDPPYRQEPPKTTAHSDRYEL